VLTQSALTQSVLNKSVLNKSVLAIIATFLLAGCGFHLRGSMTLPANVGPIKIVARDRYSPLTESLAQALRRSGAQVSIGGRADDGSTILNIRLERWASRPISVDQSGRSQEYSLRYATVFSMRRPDGVMAVPEQSIELARDYISVPTQSEGTESEREILAREMEREMVASIMRRIDAVAKAPQPAASGTTQSP